MKPKHYPHAIGHGLYRALAVAIDDPDLGPYTEEDRANAIEELRTFHEWLATTDAGHGLTAEPESAFLARVEAGVSARMDGDAVVIRVSRRAKK
jgi:hypothetical protein